MRYIRSQLFRLLADRPPRKPLKPVVAIWYHGGMSKSDLETRLKAINAEISALPDGDDRRLPWIKRAVELEWRLRLIEDDEWKARKRLPD